MAVDYEKLLELDYTAHDHVMDFKESLDEQGINYPMIEVGRGYTEDSPTVLVRAVDKVHDTEYIDAYKLEGVTQEEFEDVMFDTWESAMKELEY